MIVHGLVAPQGVRSHIARRGVKIQCAVTFVGEIRQYKVQIAVGPFAMLRDPARMMPRRYVHIETF